MSSVENKLIYKNTLIIYVRMLIVTFVGLFSSRFVLQALGASDYGLYNVVGGLIAMLNFIVSAMSTTTRRFVNVEMGKPNGNLNRVFNVCLLLHVCFALFIFIVAESVGIWYITNHLNVAPGKEDDAMFVFQISTIIACIGIINVPYQSLIEAFEQFGKSAIIDISTTIFKFGLVLVLLFYNGNALRFYAILMCVVTMLSFALYHWVCYKQWPEVIKHRLYKNSALYKEILVFNNYTALGAAAHIGKTQGANLVVNYFFGTIVNAAFAIAYQIESYVYMFVNKITLATNPQVAKNYSGDNLDRVNYLVQINSRYCILIMTLFFFPLIAEIGFILDLWLFEVPDGAVFLCTLTLIDNLVKSFGEGTHGIIQASGKVKWFQIVGSLFLLLNLPLSVLLFYHGWKPYWIIILFILTTVLNRIVSLFMMHYILDFDSLGYVNKAYVRPIAVISLLSIFVYLYHLLPIEGITMHLMGIAVILLITMIAVYSIGFTAVERKSIYRKSLYFIQRNRHSVR